MARLPFDPMRIKPADAGPPAQRDQARYGQFDFDRPLSVSQACDLIKRVLADRTPSPMKIVGEVSNFSDRGHWYFSLKDETSVISCVMWTAGAKRCGFVPDRGQQVVATGRLDFYGPQGRLQLYVDAMEPVGQGVLEMKFRQMCDELRGLGYFDDARKRPMPRFPRHLAVVTSATGAALHDVIRTARNRWPGIALSLVDVRVQGSGAAGEIAAALDALSRGHEALGIDAIILTRGGGSLEDLWAFNERVVADAVLRCAVPIAAAIGHETDTTIAELVADLRCSTPTQAAARLVPDAAAERQRVEQGASRLANALRRSVQQARMELDAAAGHWIFRRPADLIEHQRTDMEHLRHRLTASATARMSRMRHELSDLRHRLAEHEPRSVVRIAAHDLAAAERGLAAAMERRIKAAAGRIGEAERVLKAVGPASVLQRGFGYVTDEAGRLVRSVEQVAAGMVVTTTVSDGQFRSQVVGEVSEGGKKGDAGGAGAAGGVKKGAVRRVAKQRDRDGGGSDGAGLFGAT